MKDVWKIIVTVKETTGRDKTGLLKVGMSWFGGFFLLTVSNLDTETIPFNYF